MNNRQRKKLSKIAMKAVREFDDGYMYRVYDYVQSIEILSYSYVNKAVVLDFNEESMMIAFHQPNIKHLSVGKKIHFMANYLKDAGR